MPTNFRGRVAMAPATIPASADFPSLDAAASSALALNAATYDFGGTVPSGTQDLIGFGVKDTYLTSTLLSWQLTALIARCDALTIVCADKVIPCNRTTPTTYAPASLIHGHGGAIGAPLAARRCVGSGTWLYQRVPTIIQAGNGDLLAFCELRNVIADTGQDESVNAIGCCRSSDNGATWTPWKAIYTMASGDGLGAYTASSNYINNPCPAVTNSGKLFVLFSHNGKVSTDSGKMWYLTSADHGKTWTSPVECTSGVKAGITGMTRGPFPGPSAGIQLQYGPKAGRLLWAGYYYSTVSSVEREFVNCMWTDNPEAASPTFSAGTINTGTVTARVQEPAVVERTDGQLLILCRDGANNVLKQLVRSHDQGATVTVAVNTTIPDPSVNGAVLRSPWGTLLFVSSHDLVNNSNIRQKLTVWESTDEGETWTRRHTLHPLGAGYCGATALANGDVVVVYERGRNQGSGTNSTADGNAFELGVCRFNQNFVQGTQPRVYEWHFNDGRVTGEPVVSVPSGETVPATHFLDVATPINRDLKAAISDGTSNAAWATDGSNLCLQLSAAGTDRIVFAQANMEALHPGASESFTFECEVTIPSAATTGCVFATCASGAGYRVTLGAVTAGVPRFIISDGTTSVNVDATTAVNTNAKVRIAIQVDRSVNKARLFINGTQEGGDVSWAGGTTQPTGALTATTGGSLPDGTSRIASMKWHFARWTAAALAVGSMYAASIVKRGRNRPSIDIASWTGSPAQIGGANCVFWAPPPIPGVAFSDRGGGQQHPKTFRNGTAVKRALDYGSWNKEIQWRGTRESNAILDAGGFGPCYDLTADSTSAPVGFSLVNSNAGADATNNLDFLHKATSPWTILFNFAPGRYWRDGVTAISNALMVVFDNTAYQSAPGLYVSIRPNAGGTNFNLLIYTRDGSSATLVYDLTVTVTPWWPTARYSIGIVWPNTSNKLRVFMHPWTTATVANYATDSSNNFSARTGASSSDLVIGGDSRAVGTSVNAVAGYVQQVAIVKQAFAQADMQAFVDFSKRVARSYNN